MDSKTKSYYNQDDSFTLEARSLSFEVEEYIMGLMSREVEKGFSIREMSHIMMGAIPVAEARTSLMKRMNQARADEEAKE